MHLKQKAHAHFCTTAQNNILSIQQTLAELKDSSTNETKSTAGDKHETALAMLQIEQAKNRAQLHNAKQQLQTLTQIKAIAYNASVIQGSLVHTTLGYFYISTALGKAVIENILVFAISTESPLGKKLLGLQVQNNFVINNSKATVIAIW